MANEVAKFYGMGEDCGRAGCRYRFGVHQHALATSAAEGVRAVAEDVAQVAARLASAEEQLQVGCGLAFDAGRRLARAKWKDQMMDAANCNLRRSLSEAQKALLVARGPKGPAAQIHHLGQKLFAERRAYRAGVEAARAEMLAVVRRNEELTTALGLMAKRASIADELLGHDASGSALSSTLEYAADLLAQADPDEGLFAELLRKKALLVRTLAVYPGGPAPKDVADVSSEPDGATRGGGQVFLIADREVVSEPGAVVEVTLRLTPEAADGLRVPAGALDGSMR